MAGSETGRLLGAALDGEATARADLLERLRPRVVLWAAARLSPALRGKVEPEDVAQDVLLAVHKDLDQFEGRDAAAFLRWLFTISENRIRDLAKHFGARKRQLPEPKAFRDPSASSVASRVEEIARMRRAVERLPDDYREIVRLRAIEELPYEEVAKRMERSTGASRVLHCRALATLRDTLELDGG